MDLDFNASVLGGLAALVFVLALGALWTWFVGPRRNAREDEEAGVDIQGGGGPDPKVPPK